MTKDDFSKKQLRVLPADYPEQARRRIRGAFGLTEEELTAEFKKLRRGYDDARRTPSKRALLEFTRQQCEAKRIPIYPSSRDPSK